MPRGSRKKALTVWDRRTESENEYASEVGKRVAQARHEADNMTQRELADLLGVTERSVAAYESGEVIPYRFVRDLERFLGRPAGWFLHGENHQPQQDQQFQLLIAEIHKLREELAKKKVI